MSIFKLSEATERILGSLTGCNYMLAHVDERPEQPETGAACIYKFNIVKEKLSSLQLNDGHSCIIIGATKKNYFVCHFGMQSHSCDSL